MGRTFWASTYAAQGTANFTVWTSSYATEVLAKGVITTTSFQGGT